LSPNRIDYDQIETYCTGEGYTLADVRYQVQIDHILAENPGINEYREEALALFNTNYLFKIIDDLWIRLTPDQSQTSGCSNATCDGKLTWPDGSFYSFETSGVPIMYD